MPRSSREAPPKPSANPSIQVITRAVAVLRALKGARMGLSLAQIATRAALPRSTVQRLIGALVEEHLVIPAGPLGGYRLGPEIQALARSGKMDISETVRPHIVALSAATGETVDFSVLRGQEVLFLDQVTGTQRLRAVSAAGEVFPLTNTANGKCLLSLLDPARAEALVRRELPNARRANRLLAELKLVRATKIGFNHEEHTLGISAVGIGLRDAAGGYYAISVPVPTPRFALVKDQIIAALRQTCGRIVHDLGAEARNAGLQPDAPEAGAAASTGQ